MDLVTKKTSLTESVRAYYDKLFQDGFLVSVHVSKWGMSTNLSKEDIDYDGTVPSIFKLGKKMLINPERLNAFSRIESRARRFLSTNSYDFPIGDAHFVPKRKVAEVLRILDRHRQDYETLRGRFIENYAAYKAEILDKYPDIAPSLEPLYPKIETLMDRFNFSVSLYEIQMPRELAEVDIQTLIERDEARTEVKAELEEQLAAHHRASIGKLETFAEEAAKVLRGQIVTMCNAVISKIQYSEVISSSYIQGIRDEIDNFRKLNFLDDKVVEAELDKLATVVQVNINYKTDKEALAALNIAVTNVLDKANNLEDLSTISDAYFRRAIKI